MDSACGINCNRGQTSNSKRHPPQSAESSSWHLSTHSTHTRRSGALLLWQRHEAVQRRGGMWQPYATKVGGLDRGSGGYCSCGWLSSVWRDSGWCVPVAKQPQTRPSPARPRQQSNDVVSLLMRMLLMAASAGSARARAQRRVPAASSAAATAASIAADIAAAACASRKPAPAAPPADLVRTGAAPKRPPARPAASSASRRAAAREARQSSVPSPPPPS